MIIILKIQYRIKHPKLVNFIFLMSVNACDKKTDFFRRLSGQSSGLMVLLSVVLHSAIALIPLKKPPDPLAQVVLESPPAITVTQLPELPPPEVPKTVPKTVPETVPESADSQPIPPQPIPPQPVIPQPVAPNPAPPPVVAETSSDMPVENVPVGNTATENTAVANEESGQPSSQSNEAKVAAMAIAWDGFLGSLQSGLSESSLQQVLNLFGQPGQEDLFFDANQQPKTSVVSHHLLEDKTPEQVFEQSVEPELNEREGFEVRVYGEFAGGPVYEVVQGEVVHYLNIVPLNERSGSVLIVSDRPPGA